MKGSGWVSLLVVPALLAGTELGAQERRSLSLAEALARAESTSEDVAVAAAGVRRGRGEQLRARSEYFPQLSATVAYNRTLASEFEGVFGGGNGADTTSAPPDSSGGGGIDFSDLPFGRENVWQVGLQLSQSVFTGGRVQAQNRIANASRSAAEVQLATARAQTLLDVAAAYYDAALSERLVTIAEATLAQSEETLRQARLSREVGQVPEFELLRAQVQRDNQVPIVIQQRSQRDLAVLRLKQLLEIPVETPLELTTPLNDEELPGAVARDTSAVPAAAARAPVRQAEAAVRIQEATLDIAQSQRFPSINVASNYTRVNYPAGFAPEFDEFRTNWTLGVNLAVPLFTGGRIRGDEVVAEAGVAEARARLRRTVELAELDTRSTQQQLAAAEASWRASLGTVEQAERAYRIAELRYREGVSTQLELSDARILLQQAQATRARAARELQVARMRLVLLQDLPLSTGMPAAAATQQPQGTTNGTGSGQGGQQTGTGGAAQRGPGSSF